MNQLRLSGSMVARFATALAAFALSSQAFSADLAGCRPQLEKALCYSETVANWASADDLTVGLKASQERSCLTMPESIRQTMLSVYDQYPKLIQQAFCEIKKVFIIRGDVSYGAQADYYYDLSTVKIEQGDWNPTFHAKPIGYVLEISEKNRFKQETASAYVTRVLQARFGNASGLTADLPVGEYETPFGTDGALGTTIVHELGHMLGRAQRLTSTYFHPFSESVWSKITFSLNDGAYSPKEVTFEFYNRIGLKSLGVADVPYVLDFFRSGGLSTLYGASNPQEDFAEFFMLSQYPKLKWKVRDGVAFDFQKELASNPVFKAKADIVRKAMSLPEPFSLKNRGLVGGEVESQ
jgi:hypothetical protein